MLFLAWLTTSNTGAFSKSPGIHITVICVLTQPTAAWDRQRWE